MISLFAAIARKVIQSACSELHAELAFIWIAFVLITFVLGYTIVLGMRQQSRGDRTVS